MRRYLMDGEVFPREWSEDRIRESEALYARRGVGLWQAFENARAHAGFTEIVAGVDQANAASIRVLEKLGFAKAGSVPGAFGNTFTYRLPHDKNI